MSNTSFLVESVLRETLGKLRQVADDSQRRWDITLESADTLYNWKDTSVKVLIQLLSDPDPQIVTLAMVYLDLLHGMGLKASQAIEPIRRAAAKHASSRNIAMMSGLALAVLGDPPYVKVRESSMREMNTKDVRKFNSGGVATVIKYLAHGAEPE